jgi:hypothetical protein
MKGLRQAIWKKIMKYRTWGNQKTRPVARAYFDSCEVWVKRPLLKNLVKPTTLGFIFYLLFLHFSFHFGNFQCLCAATGAPKNKRNFWQKKMHEAPGVKDPSGAKIVGLYCGKVQVFVTKDGLAGNLSSAINKIPVESDRVRYVCPAAARSVLEDGKQGRRKPKAEKKAEVEG